MQRSDVVLAALSAANGGSYSPVQIQKLLFLIDQSIPAFIGGPQFSFVPYDYGPFDHQVYREIESLVDRGLVEIVQAPAQRVRTYRPTEEGLRLGQLQLNTFPGNVAEYITQLATWVRSLSFVELVSAIYQQYPGTRVNSVFKATNK
jgi:hypothetical protein